MVVFFRLNNLHLFDWSCIKADKTIRLLSHVTSVTFILSEKNPNVFCL